MTLVIAHGSLLSHCVRFTARGCRSWIAFSGTMPTQPQRLSAQIGANGDREAIMSFAGSAKRRVARVTKFSRTVEFDDDLYEHVCSAVAPGNEIATLTNKRVNRIVAIDRSGVFVETDRSQRLGTGAQLVPAWMIMTAWHHLRRNGRLTNEQLVNELNAKRSAFVCALLAQFPDVVVLSTRPIVLELNSRDT